ncbi:conserved hypothetical protein [Ricinus communis]|uniref:Uncharacterized protein n=1 Tax=Ricinus communis TaxID=3988 RepID=B9RMX4_RICCO|nr:conserved hypothetical protein [Ricinus communis]
MSQDLDKLTTTDSPGDEGESRSTAMSTCETIDFDFQNPDTKMDISKTSQEAEAKTFEVDPLEALYNGLEAFLELEDNLNVALFPPLATDEGLSYTSFDVPLILQG